MKRMLIAVGLCGALGACVPTGLPEPGPGLEPDPIENACGALALQGLVGQSARVLETIRFGTNTRIIRPGMAVTMDFNPDRLNVEIDAAERISRIYCS